MRPGNAQCAVHVDASWGADEWKEAAAYPAKTPSGHSFECSPVKRGKIWDCVASLFPHLSCQIFKNAFCSVSQCGFWWIHLKETSTAFPVQCFRLLFALCFPLSSQKIQNVVLQDFCEGLEAEPIKTGFFLQMDVSIVLHCKWHQNVALMFAQEEEYWLEPGLL